MLIASKLPPLKTNRTWFASGRAAFAFLLHGLTTPRRIWMPTLICWSLVATLEQRFSGLEVEFYPVDGDLTCHYPPSIGPDEVLLFVHYFGLENSQSLPHGEGIAIEDISHACLSQVAHRGDLVFGSCRKLFRVGDGGFVEGFQNPVYEPDRKLSTWLRYEAVDWRDMREADNMLDRDWSLSDISSQSLAVLLKIDEVRERQSRQLNERFLFENIPAGRTLRAFNVHECPLIHIRFFETKAERDDLKNFLSSLEIFTSIHWPICEHVARCGVDIRGAEAFQNFSVAFPVASVYSLADMERIVEAISEWSR